MTIPLQLLAAVACTVNVNELACLASRHQTARGNRQVSGSVPPAPRMAGATPPLAVSSCGGTPTAPPGSRPAIAIT